MALSKISGIVLLVIGVLLIVVPLWQTYEIFTGKSLPPQVFMKPMQNTNQTPPSSLDISAQIAYNVQKAIPTDFINNSLNLADWLILMWILIYGGGKLADIGVKLMKADKAE